MTMMMTMIIMNENSADNPTEDTAGVVQTTDDVILMGDEIPDVVHTMATMRKTMKMIEIMIDRTVASVRTKGITGTIETMNDQANKGDPITEVIIIRIQKNNLGNRLIVYITISMVDFRFHFR